MQYNTVCSILYYSCVKSTALELEKHWKFSWPPHIIATFSQFSDECLKENLDDNSNLKNMQSTYLKY